MPGNLCGASTAPQPPGMAETAQALGGSLQDIVRQDEFYGLTAETISTILKGKYAGDGWLWDFRTIM
ncbi:hypothetical protein DW886_18595 [Enterocloster aldenensis]|nr:hypothetical protein DW886_18595 [Enterocloster aldenensis]